MRKIFRSMAALVLAIGAIMACDVESRAAGGASPVSAAEL